ncbi:YhgE/Pip domain-containing protein [Paenibacillus sp. GXUN7292]|uniref:YhgE/Pip domain-containing protein n=1 Tax=Paenibacillus sp. GXUN7292 TaxID=3422499 RepID=UPI003D7C6FD0
MVKGLKALFKIRATYIGIAAAIAFQLIFFTVWMTAYDGVSDRFNHLKVGLLNEDAGIGQDIAQRINESLPFQIETYSSLKLAQTDMNDRKIEMIIQIPDSLSNSMQSGAEASIVYWVNQSNSSLTKTMMENTAFHLNEQINQQLFAFQKSEATSVFGQQISNAAIPKELADSIGSSVKMLVEHMKDKPIGADIKKVNNAEGFAANFVPFMIIISSFVGAMVMIMQHQDALQLVKGSVSKWGLFASRQIINIGVAFILPILTIGLMSIFNITSEVNTFSIYLFQSIMFWAFLSLAQIFVLLFGNLGMLFNILALSLQLVTSGVLVPKAALSEGYIKLASILPATYGADGYYTIIFGGGDASIRSNIVSLLGIVAVTLLISSAAVALKKDYNKHIEVASSLVK